MQRIGAEFSCVSRHLTESMPAEYVDLEPALYELRRFKHPMSWRRLKKAIAARERCYKRAREIVEPGINELTVFNELQAAASMSTARCDRHGQ